MDSSNIYKEIKEINNKLTDVQVLLARNTESLEYHIKRTDLLEEDLEVVKDDLTKVRGFFTIGGWVVGIAATVLTMMSRMKLF